MQRYIPKSYAMSGCGWLLPFHLGVVKSLRDSNMINKETIFAGTSGGSLSSLIALCDIPAEKALELIIKLSKDSNFKSKIDQDLKKFLTPLLPSNTLSLCNNKLFVTSTRIWPNPKIAPHIVSEFDSIDYLLDMVTASCFIPFYSSSEFLFKKIVNKRSQIEYYIDGGVFSFIPPIGEVKVAPFPLQDYRLLIECDIFLPKNDDFPIMKLLKWSLNSAPEDILIKLFNEGLHSSNSWLEKKKIEKISN